MNTEQIMVQRRQNNKKLGLLTVILGAVGWFAAFQLLIEFLRSLQIEDYVPNCSLSLLVTCEENLSSWQGSLFGINNTIIGVILFTIPVLIGVAMLAEVKFPKWWWHLYSVGLLGGFLLVMWFSYQSFFSLYSLCPWCMLVWLIMVPLFWVTVSHIYGSGQSDRAIFRNIYSLRWLIVLFFYLLVASVAQIQLDWIGEF